MTCYHPLQAVDCGLKVNGKRELFFLKKADYVWPVPDNFVQVPCGNCLGCRIEYSRSWALRCEHEAKMHRSNSFITLTYNNDNLPRFGTLVKEHMRDFWKRLRYYIGDERIRYFYCGEYGDKLDRPHYHAIVFGFDFPDKRPWKRSKGNILYRSELLEKAWTFGYSSIGTATFQSAGYIARYSLKKVRGKKKSAHYTKIDKDTGEIIKDCIPEYTAMSNRHGIGHDWFKANYKDVFPSDFIISQGSGYKRLRVPRYYDKKYQEEFPVEFELIKSRRVEKASKHSDDNSYERLLVREKCHLARVVKLLRVLETE